MIDLQKLYNTEVTTKPYEHIVCENTITDINAVNEIYDFFSESAEWNIEQPNQQFNLPEYNDQSTQLVNLFEQFDWQPIMNKLGVTYSRLSSGFTGSNMNYPLDKHTDEPEITGVVAKYLFYMTPGLNNGTRIHDSENNIYTTPGAPGDLFIFKTSPTSFHSSDYTGINKDTKRIILVGCFHA